MWLAGRDSTRDLSTHTGTEASDHEPLISSGLRPASAALSWSMVVKLALPCCGCRHNSRTSRGRAFINITGSLVEVDVTTEYVPICNSQAARVVRHCHTNGDRPSVRGIENGGVVCLTPLYPYMILVLVQRICVTAPGTRPLKRVQNLGVAGRMLTSPFGVLTLL